MFTPDQNEIITQLEQDTSRYVDGLINGLDDKKLNYLFELIRARRPLVKTTAAYGNEVVAISKQILAFGGAGVPLLAAFYGQIKTLPDPIFHLFQLGAFFYLNITLSSMLILGLFAWLSRYRYPFLYLSIIGNTVPFFYYKTISPETPYPTFPSSEKKISGMRYYADDFKKFVKYHVDNLPEVSDTKDSKKPSKQELRDEIQQYFLRISYQAFTNQFEVRLTNLFIISIVSSAVAALILTIAFSSF